MKKTIVCIENVTVYQINDQIGMAFRTADLINSAPSGVIQYTKEPFIRPGVKIKTE